MLDLYKISEVNSHKFLKIPKALFDNEAYRTGLTSDAKMAYAMLLDRMELSKKNGWVNDDGEIFLLFTKDNMAEMLGIGERTAYRAFKQLQEFKLIKQVRQGLNRPNMIYIGKINPLFTRTCQIGRSEHAKMAGQDKSNWQGNYTEGSETEGSETDTLAVS